MWHTYFLWKIQRFFKNSLIILGDLWKKSKILKNSLIVSDDLPVFSEKIQRFFKNYPIVSGNLPVFMKKKIFLWKNQIFFKNDLIVQVTYMFVWKVKRLLQNYHSSSDLPVFHEKFKDFLKIVSFLRWPISLKNHKRFLRWSYYNRGPT